MFILSQNKEKLYNLSGHIEGIGYEETKEYVKGKKEDKIRHTLMVYDGCCEEVAEYMAAVENNGPDPMKAFKAIAMILNAREEGVKVRLTSVRKVEEDVRKAG